MHICIFGLGEAGSAIGVDLVASGMDVSAYDPAGVPTPDGIVRHETPGSALEGAELVLALTVAEDAPSALEQAADQLTPAMHYADLSTASPGRKRDLAAVAEALEVTFTDGALMAPVPGKGIRTPVLASGIGAPAFARMMAPLGMRVDIAGVEAGLAATHKLLRSVTIKGLAAVLIESLEAAQKVGIGDDVWSNLVDQLSAADETFLRRIITGTRAHSVRRTAEMEAAVELLEELGLDPIMSRSTVASLRRVSETGEVPDLPL